jgi:hypothetical protein
MPGGPPLSPRCSAGTCPLPKIEALRLELIRAGIVARDEQALYEVGPPIVPLTATFSSAISPMTLGNRRTACAR